MPSLGSSIRESPQEVPSSVLLDCRSFVRACGGSGEGSEGSPINTASPGIMRSLELTLASSPWFRPVDPGAGARAGWGVALANQTREGFEAVD